jgi:ATP-independent RNA helicase DbpA
VQSVAGGLKSAGFSAAALHGEMEQRDRDQTLVRFSNGSLLILVATDVAARGLDIESIDLVLNHSLAREMEVYVHRIGRTGRAGAKGLACSVFTPAERFRLDKLSGYLEMECEQFELPLKALIEQTPTKSNMSTLRIEGGKKQKLRPGDILGALTSTKDDLGAINGDQIGKIQVGNSWSYVAIEREVAKLGVTKLMQGRLKGKKFRARLI